MCGFVGVASNKTISDKNWLFTARDTITHRGPDDAGEWWSKDDRVGLYHRRLSILDLSSLAHQPMHDTDRKLSIVFNGEIYNYLDLRNKLIAKGHSFHSDSDTEVLLAAYVYWGEDCLAQLNGMLAFAIYDEQKDILFLARDRAGEKPLYYRYADGIFEFASELKALFSNPSASRRIDPLALDCYLAMGFVPGRYCILDGYNKLPPAHAMSVNLREGIIRTWRYWSLPMAPKSSMQDVQTEDELIDELEELLEDTVSKQLVADVPVGILLSGGVDSSLITAMAVRNSQKVRTFSIGFPGHGSFDETDHARLIARHFDTDHTELMAEPTTADLIPCLSHQFDEPMVDSSMIPTWLVSHLVRQHCTVALGGDGGDELFGGYPHYSRLLWMQQHLEKIPAWIRQWPAIFAEKILPVGFANSNIRTWLMAAGDDFVQSLPFVTGHFDVKTRQNLLNSQESSMPVAERIYQEHIPANVDLLQRATRMDFNYYLAEDLLVKVDRASMLASLEMRAPMLDYRLIEFAFGRVPSRFKVTVDSTKILLKRLASRVLPAQFDIQRKQGFSIPLTEWLKDGPFRNLFWDTLTSNDCIFDRATVKSLLKNQDRGLNNGERLFALVHFELWRKHYGATL